MGYERATGDFVGWYALIPHEPDEYEIGYRLRREMWGKGLATEGMRALIDAAFDVLGARRLWAQTMAVEHAVPSGHGALRSGLPAHVPPRVGRPDPGHGGGRGRVRAPTALEDRAQHDATSTIMAGARKMAFAMTRRRPLSELR